MAFRNLHVVGCPRSGTTLIAEMLVACYPHSGHSQHEESVFKVPVARSGLYLSKQPNDALWVRPLLSRDPNLYVIAMMRDPRSVVCSMHDNWPGMYFCNYPVWKRAETAVSRIMAHPRVLVVRYEDLTRDPQAIQRRIEAHFPFLERLHAFEDFHKVAQSSEASRNALGGIRAVDTARVSGWRAHLPRLKHQMDLHPGLGVDVLRHAYEADEKWQEILQDVRPIDFPCRYSEATQPLKLAEQRIRFWWKTKRYLRERGLQ